MPELDRGNNSFALERDFNFQLPDLRPGAPADSNWPGPVVIGGSDLVDPRVLLVGAAVGVLSSVIPYSCELVALRTLSPGVFGILMSLEPAAAALAGIVVLGELLGPPQYAAIACVVAASVGATRSGQQAVLRD